MKERRTRGSRMPSRLLAVGSAVVLSIGVAACGDDEEEGGGGGGGGAGTEEEVTVGLITKTETNPFFVKMKEGAQAEAKGATPSCSRAPARPTATTPAR